MEGQMSKRRRIYSQQLNSETISIVFALKYMQHLVPALKKINKKKKSSVSGNANDACELREYVKYEMEVALALSTGSLGFLWCQSLGNNLHTSGGGSQEHANFTQFPTNDHINNSKYRRHENVDDEYKGWTTKGSETEELEVEDKHEQIGDGHLSSLRKLLPGGEGILDEEQVLVEVSGYITCLQQQLHILQCLVHDHASSCTINYLH